MAEGTPGGPTPDEFVIPPEDRPYGLRKRPKTVPQTKDNEFHDDDMSSLSSLSESEPSEHQFAEEEEEDDDEEEDEEEYDDEPVKGKKKNKQQQHGSNKATTGSTQRRSTMGPPVNTTPLSHLQYSHLTKTYPPRTSSLPPARGNYPYSHSYPAYPPQQRPFALFIAPPTPLLDQLSVRLPDLIQNARIEATRDESLQGQSQTELEGSILRLPTRKHRSALCLTMNRYSSFCCSPAVNIPAFPITATKAALFLSRASDTPIGLSLRVTLPQPVTYPTPIVSQLHKPSPLPPPMPSASSSSSHLSLPPPPSPERVTKELVQSWSEALAYAQSATRVVWESVFSKEGVGEKERMEATAPLLNEGCMREVLNCFESAKGMVERGRRSSGSAVLPRSSGSAVGRTGDGPPAHHSAGGSGRSAVANGNGAGGESMGTPPMTGKRSSMDEDPSSAKKKTKWVKGGRSVEAPRKSGNTPPAGTPTPTPAAPPAGYTYYVGGPGEDVPSHPQGLNLAPQHRPYATHSPDGSSLSHTNGASPVFAASPYPHHLPPHSYPASSNTPMYYTALQAPMPSPYGAGAHALHHAGPTTQHPYAPQYHAGAGVGPFTYQARGVGDLHARRELPAKRINATGLTERSAEGAATDLNGVGAPPSVYNGNGASKSPQAGTAGGSGDSEGGSSPRPAKASPSLRSNTGPTTSPELTDTPELGKKVDKGKEPGKENEAQAIEKGQKRGVPIESPPPTASSSSSFEHDPSNATRAGEGPRYRPHQAASPNYAHGYAQQYWYPTGVQPGYPAPSPYTSNMYAPQGYPGAYAQGAMWPGAAQSFYPPSGYVQPGQYRYDGLLGSPTSSSSLSQAHSTDASSSASTSVSTSSAGTLTSSSAHHATTSSHVHAHATNPLSNSAYQTHSRDPTLSVDISSLSGANNMYGSPTEYGGSASASSSYGPWPASATDIFKR